MNTQKINEMGKKYGQWTVISPAESQKRGALWNCVCGCGEKKIIRGSHLRRAETLACNLCTRKKNHLKIINNKDIIDGLLLGDGCISVKNGGLFAILNVSQTDRGLVEYLRDKICPEAKINERKTKRKTIYYFSVTNSSLIPIRERWYPNGKKIVPKNLIFTPLMVLNWFMGDGSTSFTKNKKQVNLTLSTESFTKEEVIFLKNGLSKAIGQEIRISTNKGSFSDRTYFRLSSGKSSFTNAFFDYVGECPVECMKYKWKRGRVLNKKL